MCSVVPAWPPHNAAAFHYKGLYAFPGRVQGRRQPRGTSPNNDEVVELAFGLGADAQLLGKLGIGGLNQDRAIFEDYGRNNLLAVVDPLNITPALSVLVDVDPVIGNALLS